MSDWNTSINFTELISVLEKGINSDYPSTTVMTSSKNITFTDTLKSNKTLFLSILRYTRLVVAVLGVPANVLNITVLSRKNMKSSIYTLLLSLAVADMIVLLSDSFINLCGLPFTKYCHFNYACTVAFHAIGQINIIGFLTSIWLTFVVAVWRFMYVCYPAETERWRRRLRAALAIAATCVMCTLFRIPWISVYRIFRVVRRDDLVYYKIVVSKTYRTWWRIWHNTFQKLFVTIEILPCALLPVLTLGLIRALYKANKKRMALNFPSKSGDRYDSITKMLIVVLVIFVLTNVPLALSNGISIPREYIDFEVLFLEMALTLSVVNNAYNFVAYYFMSSEFRETFVSIFLQRWKSNSSGCTSRST